MNATVLGFEKFGKTQLDSTSLLTRGHVKYNTPLEFMIISGERKGERLAIKAGKQKLGRAPQNDIHISDSTISANHAIVEYKDVNQVIIYDLASRNGISMNGVQKPVIELQKGDIVQVGGVHLKLFKPSADKTGSLRNIAIATTVSILFALIAFTIHGSKPKAMMANEVSQLKSSQKVMNVATQQTSERRSLPARRIRRVQMSRPMSAPPQMERVRSATARQADPDAVEEEARSALESGNYSLAYSLWRDLISVVPGNRYSIEGFQNLESIARKLMEEVTMIGEAKPQDAATLLHKVVGMTLPTSATHHEAQVKLEKMEHV